MMEARREEFIAVLESTGETHKEAVGQVEDAIERWVWYAGWADKIHHVLGTVNPVAGPYFNFTMPEPTGVVGVVASEEPALLGIVSRLAPIIVSGNTAVVVVDAEAGLAAVTLAEVLATSDLPGGVVNLLTGDKKELLPWMLGHLDINSVDLTGTPNDIDHEVLEESAVNVKRAVWGDPADESPYVIADFLEMKTVWHPIGL
jgi:acyl-CoA reductase-like NAD-dependent aldehyde dehydrogenase